MTDFLTSFASWISTPGNALLWSAATFLAGALVGNWLSRDWDRAKEFNGLATPISAQLLEELANISPYVRYPDLSDIVTLGLLMRRGQRLRFNRAWEAYKLARTENQVNHIGHVSYTRTDHIEAAIHELLRHIKRR